MDTVGRTPQATLAELLSSDRDTVEVASQREGEKVRATAANPESFTVERSDDGSWRVRYVGRVQVCPCRAYETDTPNLYRDRSTARCPSCGSLVPVLSVDGATVRLAAHRGEAI